MDGHILRALIPHIYPSVGYCAVYLYQGLSTTFRKINENQLHTFFVYVNHLGAGYTFVATMNQKLQDSYEAIIDELKLTEIKSFKIGITHDLDERKEKYISEGYSEVYAIANGDNESIIQAESDLIEALMSDGRVCSKCDNKSATLELGRTESADTLYVAVRIEFDKPASSVDIHLKNILFASCFPISF